MTRRVEDTDLRYGLVVYSLATPDLKRMLVCHHEGLPTEWVSIALVAHPLIEKPVFHASFTAGHNWQTDEPPR